MERLIQFLANHPLVSLALFVFVIGGVWKAYAKAGQPGWASVIPIYNLVVLARIAAMPWWTLLLFFVPVVSVFTALVYYVRVAKRFDHGPLFGIGLLLLPVVFWPVLGYGSSRARALVP